MAYLKTNDVHLIGVLKLINGRRERISYCSITTRHILFLLLFDGFECGNVIILHYLLSGCCCTIEFTSEAVLRVTAVQHAHQLRLLLQLCYDSNCRFNRPTALASGSTTQSFILIDFSLIALGFVSLSNYFND